MYIASSDGSSDDGKLYVDKGIATKGSVKWLKSDGGTSYNAYVSSNFMFLRNYGEYYTILDIWATNSDPSTSSVNSESTLCLKRADNDEKNVELLDLYNNGYYTSDAVYYGIRLQKRGLGEYRDFRMEYSNGNEKVPIITFHHSLKLGIGSYSEPGAFVHITNNRRLTDITFSGTGIDDMRHGVTSASPSDTGTYIIEIDAEGVEGAPDSFKWSDNNGTTWTTDVVISERSHIELSNNITVYFANETGHTLGDQWTFISYIPEAFKITGTATDTDLLRIDNDGNTTISGTINTAGNMEVAGHISISDKANIQYDSSGDYVEFVFT